MAKNSFSLFETVLALIILLFLVSGFSKFTYSKNTQKATFLNLKNLLITNQSDAHITYENLSYNVIGENIVLHNGGNEIILSVYHSDEITLEKFALRHKPSQNIAFKEVE
ncbi:MAG: hypothetical protein ACNI3C_00755 [Candidatus Marinarcus sp.]|uniref:hypothetical protein n=1 Tax=Candidatus Marinarcus sp. TaxID=3100987 RepID=UPI003B00D565